MEKQAFWKLIDESRDAADGDPEAHLATLEEAVSQLGEADIVAFDHMFTAYYNRAYDHGLWGAAYVIGGGCSDDGFSDFRGWLISKGEDVFEAALRDPESLAGVVEDEDGECQVEGFLYIPNQVWERITGRPADEFPAYPSGYPAKPSGERWEEDDLEDRFPKLCQQFG